MNQTARSSQPFLHRLERTEICVVDQSVDISVQYPLDMWARLVRSSLFNAWASALNRKARPVESNRNLERIAIGIFS